MRRSRHRSIIYLICTLFFFLINYLYHLNPSDSSVLNKENEKTSTTETAPRGVILSPELTLNSTSNLLKEEKKLFEEQPPQQQQQQTNSFVQLNTSPLSNASSSISSLSLNTLNDTIPTAFFLRHFCSLVDSIPSLDSMWNFARVSHFHRELTELPSSLTSQWYCNPMSLESTPTVPLLQHLEKNLYPWLKTSTHDLYSTFQPGRAIVYTTGKHHAHYVYLSIKALRYLRCTLPIIIVYKDDNDLPRFYKDQLESLEKVTSLAIKELFHWDVADPTGWAIKPFAILFAPYQEILLMDGDVFFLQRPELLFDDKDYQSTGTLFFHDRTLFPDPKSPPHQWFQSFMPHPSLRAKHLRHWQTQSQHEQESGVVVINKAHWISFLGLLVSCNLNALPKRNEVYKHVYGDKETFWIGFELIQAPYAFMPNFGSVIGFKADPFVCGSLLHTDRHLQPLWFNNGVQVDKALQPNRLIDFDVYSLDTTTKVGWLFGPSSPNGFCMQGAPVLPLSSQDKITGKWILNLYKEAEANQTLSQFWKGG